MKRDEMGHGGSLIGAADGAGKVHWTMAVFKQLCAAGCRGM